ncbi:MAG: UDP-3-O-acyl-N-acetylglucosamine deacetylase, partial [Bacteroidota bacterium]|nr:UDP-3-O-acyl-N-acetylglucosamine deacetylase [Bacteroidota bacterium]
MINFQRTINEEGNLEGIGLHTGKKSKLKFVPALINHGIKFQRIDLDGMPIVDADVNNVIAVERGTTIKQNDATISTVEHLLAAIVGLQIDNILIQIDGEEIPILDGSSKYFIECLEKCGLKTQDAARKYIEISEKITYNDEENNVEISIYPHNDYRITSMVDYNSEILGSQHYTLNQISNFKKDVSDARTFCFLHEIEDLFKKNLIKGGDLDNAIVIVDKVIDEKKLKEISQLLGKKNIKVDKQGILNNIKLKYNNEPARHKLLD